MSKVCWKYVEEEERERIKIGGHDETIHRAAHRSMRASQPFAAFAQ
jgi:hypothetical protein